MPRRWSWIERLVEGSFADKGLNIFRNDGVVMYRNRSVFDQFVDVELKKFHRSKCMWGIVMWNCNKKYCDMSIGGISPRAGLTGI